MKSFLILLLYVSVWMGQGFARHTSSSRLHRKLKALRKSGTWDCDAIVNKLRPIVVSAIVGSISKKLLMDCEPFDVPSLNAWAPIMTSKLNRGVNLPDTIDWIVDQFKQSSETTTEATDFVGPDPPEECHDFSAWVQVVDDEPGINDDDWS